MFGWFKKKKSSDRETSPGGSGIYRYSGNEFNKTKVGFSEESSPINAEKREKVYDSFFGKCTKVFHEVIPFVPHIDVFIYEPGHKGREFYTLVTGGMSDLEMTLPSDIDKKNSRTELIFYCKELKEEYIETIRRLAHFPHDNGTWIGPGHTMPNGNPPEKLWGSEVLDTFLFIPTILSPDSSLAKSLKGNFKSPSFLWVVPISSKECSYKLEKGIGNFLDIFTENNHPHVFEPERKSYL